MVATLSEGHSQEIEAFIRTLFEHWIGQQKAGTLFTRSQMGIRKNGLIIPDVCIFIFMKIEV